MIVALRTAWTEWLPTLVQLALGDVPEPRQHGKRQFLGLEAILAQRESSREGIGGHASRLPTSLLLARISHAPCLSCTRSYSWWLTKVMASHQTLGAFWRRLWHTFRKAKGAKRRVVGPGRHTRCMATLRGEEEWARRMVECALGLPVTQHDDGSRRGMHDLDIALPDGKRAAVEVTAAADGESIALWNLINGRDEPWQVSGMRGGWFVQLAPNARARQVLRELPTLLATLEREGIREIEVGFRRRNLTVFEDAAQGLRVNRAGQGDTSLPGSIYVTIDEPLERTGGVVPITGEPLAEWIIEFLSAPERADVRAKLALAGALERHAFVLVPGFTPAPFAVVDLLMRENAPLPIRAPQVMTEVTHVWVASTWTSGHGVRWSPGSGWSRFAKRLEDRSRASA